MVGQSSRCGCRCECVTRTSDVVRNNNNDDAPDAVLEGLAMAGLVAILRQLGDLAELAAEVFDDMQDQVMAASARGRRLAVRAKRLLEADLDLPPPTSTHSSAAATALTSSITNSGSSTTTYGGAGRLGIGCRAHAHLGVGGGTTPPMPRVVVQRIKRCRGPPRLSLLDRFDAAGEGACLKRYTDPSFFFRAHSHSASARLDEVEQGALRVRANRGPYHLKSMSMESSRPRFQTALLNSEPPESAHTDSKSETETDASEATSPGFLSMLRQLKQHQQAAGAGAGSVFLRQQTAVDRVQSSPQLNMENKLQGGGGTAQPSPSPSELERTSSFEAWLAPDADAAAAALTLSSSSTMLKANKVKGAGAGNINKSRSSRGSVEMKMIASRVSSLPRKLFINIRHHKDCSRSDDRAGAGTSSLRISQATGGIGGDCSPQLEAIPTPRAREAFLPILLHSNPVVYSSIHDRDLLPGNEEHSSYLQHHESTLLPCNESLDSERHHQQEKEDPSTDQCSDDSNSSTPPDNNKKRDGALPPPENSSSEDAKVDDTTPLPLPPMQWLSEMVHTGPRPASPKHRALWGKSLEVQVAETIQETVSRSIQTPPVVDTEETLVVSDENTSRDEMRCSESEETRHPQPSRVREDAVQDSSQEGIVLKAGEFPVPALLSDEAWTSDQIQGRQQLFDQIQEHEASDDSSNLLKNESVFFSAVQELAKMSPPPPSVPRPKCSLLDAGSHSRITLRNGPSLIHPSRNILDSRSVLIQQIKDIATAGNPSFKLKPVSGASSPMTGSPSPTNSKVATILRRADDIRQAHANSHDVDSDESWSDDSD